MQFTALLYFIAAKGTRSIALKKTSKYNTFFKKQIDNVFFFVYDKPIIKIKR